MTLTITYLFWLLGVVLLIIGGMIVTDKEHPRRFTAGGFWILYALIFLIGDKLPPAVVGVAVIVMALIAGFGGVTAASRKRCRWKRARRAPRVCATSCSCPR